MVVYAAVLLAGGVIAFAIAPDKSEAKTALIVPAACATLVLISAGLSALLTKSKPAGMIGIHLGLVLPLLFAVAIGYRAYGAAAGVARHQELRSAYETDLESGNPDAADGFVVYAERVHGEEVAEHNKSYLRNTLFVLSAASTVAFVALLVQRPRPAAPAADGDASADSSSDG